MKVTSESDESENEDEDLALLTRKFKRFIKRGKFQKKWNKSQDKNKERDEAPLCFKCNKPGHLKRDCPLLKMNMFKKQNKPTKKKALQATWDESDSSSDEESSEGENAHMCFMAQDVESCSSPNMEDINMEEFLDVFNELYEKYKTLKRKTKNMNQNIENLTETNEKLINEGKILAFEKEELDYKNVELNMTIDHMKYKMKNLEKDIATLKNKSNDLLNTVTKFTKGKEILDKLLSSQRHSLNKHGLGFSKFDDVPYENGFVRATTNEKYVFIVKKHPKWFERKQNKTIEFKKKTNVMWVPKSLLASRDAGGS